MKSHIKNIPFASLRVRIMLLVLAVILPMLVLIVYDDIIDENQKRLSVLNESQKYAQNASLIYSQIISEVRLTLYHLSLMPQFQQQDREACSQIFATFLKQNKRLTALAATKSNGDVFAAAPAIAKPVNYADRPWFQRLVQTRDFVIGEYSVGRLTGKPIIVLGYPVLDLTGRLVAVLSAGLDIEYLQKTLINIRLLEGANLTVIDSNGTVIFRFPDPEKLLGRDMPEQPIVKTILTQKEGVEEGIGLDGMRRLYGFATIGSGIEAIHVCVSIPEQVAFAEVRRGVVRDFVGLGLVSVLALLGTWLFGGLLVVSPAKRLINFTQRVADGDLTVRTGQSNVSGELGLLAYNFDRMAESLQRLEQERQRAEEAIREKVAEFERWRTVTLGREDRVGGLKREINELLASQGQPPRYPSEAVIPGKNGDANEAIENANKEH